VLREVGTTNRTRISDYQNAVSERTKLLLRVHPSNFRMVGFTERPSLAELVELGSKTGIPVYEDLGSGCLVPLALRGSLDEPPAMDSLAAGVDLVSFSGDKLLGGPQAGLIAGKKDLVARIRRNPLFRALRAGKLTYSVLETTLQAYRQDQLHRIPAWRMILMTVPEIEERAKRLLQACARPGLAAQLEMELVDGESLRKAYFAGKVVSQKQHEAAVSLLTIFAQHLAILSNQVFIQQENAEPPVIKRAREGADHPFQPTGHTDATEKHAVCQQVLSSIGAGKSGSDIRKTLGGTPFGWPRDAVDAALRDVRVRP
jgi:seryl-tRNA(Sec) selenium transferase